MCCRWTRLVIEIPVPKKPVISCINDLRPVALTSIPMKICERLFKEWLSAFVEDYIDPFQFAYRSKRSCTDAILVMLEKLYHRTDRAREGNSVRIMFFDFSSAFNTIQPHLLVQKLLNHNIPGSILAWILSYLTDRSQYVRITKEHYPTVSNLTLVLLRVQFLHRFYLPCILLIADLVSLLVLWLNLLMILLWLV